MDSRISDESVERLEDELFCCRLENATMSGLLLEGKLERWVPGCCTPELERDHAKRYEWAGPRAAGKRVLDVACGAGRGTQMLAESGAAGVTGLDVDPEIVRYASLRHGGARTEFACADAMCYQPSEPYELIVSFETIEHVPDAARFLSGLAGLLAPGGEILVSTPISDCSHDPSPVNPFHVQEWGYPDFERVVPAGLQVTERWLQLTKEPRNYGRRLLNVFGAARGRFVAGEVMPAGGFEPLGRPGVKYRGFQIVVCKTG